MKANHYLAEFLARIGVKHVYQLSGGMIAPLLDAVGEHPDLRLIDIVHEQSGGFAADAEARLTNVPGIAMGTSGPGALNLATAMATSYYDSVPMLFIGGQVQSYLQVNGKATRQSGLQECPFGNVAAPICKAVFQPSSGKDVPNSLARAYKTAMSGRPGPVLLDFPFDCQIAETEAECLSDPEPIVLDSPKPETVAACADMLRAAERPIILAGGGVRTTARDAVRSLSRDLGLPMVTTISALDAADPTVETSLGLCGTYGTRRGNLALSEADAVLCIGSRLDHGVIGADPAGFSRRISVFRVEIDEGEANARQIKADVAHTDAGVFATALHSSLRDGEFVLPDAWRQRLRVLRKEMSDTTERPQGDSIDPNRFLAALGKASFAAGSYCVDAGQHTWHSAQSLRLEPNQRYISSTGLWAMGYGLPAAIGAALITKRPTVVIAGDAAVQLNIQEAAVIARERLPVKVVILDNSGHGMVRQFQDEFLDSRHHGTQPQPPDLNAVFAAYGFIERTVSKSEDIAEALDWLWESPNTPAVLRVIISAQEHVRPSVPFGQQLRSMKPAFQEG
ncbi:thiamine pyrophosphate-binding protein [Cognatiyoonia sp. IB215446]|uniref:thiamine pyrophosphate-binding protein n=1 Tax=Cognatiyoonia sp. IB215446 TaxID=3097355 RepID=UPI002A14609B|nr:thiamine pyrophosphate-binding protein [Cognatiyoonia sp. IB215446]MDX8348123.1 thiamine pyrophosphate-binding protein [Cognatiyoonia sp. IB215446]